MADDLPLSPPLLQQVPLSSLAAIAKQGQTLQPQNIQADMSSIAPAVANTVGNLTGVNDAVKALRGQMTPEEAQTFALGAIPGAMVGPEAKVAETAAEEAVPLASKVIQGIKAYHGSPYDFNQFDLSKIGTGEGAQAYGHGLYFAEAEPVAQQYRDVLASRADTNTPEGVAKFWSHMQGGRDQGIVHLQGALAQAQKYPNMFETDAVPKTQAAIDYLKSGGDLTPSSGKMYEVNINADPGHFLDWDKPLSEQSPQVQEALQPILESAAKSFPAIKQNPDVTGAGIAQAYASHRGGNADVASQSLKEAGIPGIKYLDQGSRPPRSLQDTRDSIDYYTNMLKDDPNNKFASDQLNQYQNDLQKHETGTRNYVVFNDKLIDILKKYGLAGLLGGGGAGAAMQQQPQVPLANLQLQQ